MSKYYSKSEHFHEYIKEHGPHFSKKLAAHVLHGNRLKNIDDSNHRWTKEQVLDMMKKYNIEINNYCEYDIVVAMNMAYANYYPKVLNTEQSILEYVKACLDGPNSYDGILFSQWCAKMKRTGRFVDWEEMI